MIFLHGLVSRLLRGGFMHFYSSKLLFCSFISFRRRFEGRSLAAAAAAAGVFTA